MSQILIELYQSLNHKYKKYELQYFLKGELLFNNAIEKLRLKQLKYGLYNY